MFPCDNIYHPNFVDNTFQFVTSGIDPPNYNIILIHNPNAIVDDPNYFSNRFVVVQNVSLPSSIHAGNKIKNI